MTKLYLVTEREYGEDHEQVWTFLSDYKPDIPDQEGWEISFVEATLDNITLDMLLSAIESEMENANYHREMQIPNFLSRHLLKHLPEDKVKQIFWDMVQEKGLLLF